MLIASVMLMCVIVPKQNVYAESSAMKVRPPASVKVVAKEKTKAYLKWSSVKDADGYIIYKYNKSKKKYVQIKKLKNNRKSITIKKLKKNTTEKFRVKTYKMQNGEKVLSKFSHTVSIKINKKNQNTNVRKITLNKSKYTLKKGKTVKLKAKMKPASAKNKKVIWSSSNSQIATVTKKGVVKAKAGGTVTITARSHSGFTDKCVITVPQKVKSVQFASKNKHTMECGEKQTLGVSILPADANDKRVTWKSSSKSIAVVDSHGTVTALRPGKATITVKTKSQKKTSSFDLEIIATKGFLSNDILGKINLDGTNKLMIVAHPDDETLWGGRHLVEDDYFVVCMTHGWDETRKNEFYSALKKSNDKGIILNYPDIIDGKKDEWSGVKTSLKKDIKLLLEYKNWDEIVTHNPEGEYGHIHHKLTHKAVTDESKAKALTDKLMYFGRFYWESKLDYLLQNPDSEAAQSELSNLQPMEESLLAEKQAIVNGYVSQQKGAIAAFRHMIPYENWKTYAQWYEEDKNDNGEENGEV